MKDDETVVSDSNWSGLARSFLRADVPATPGVMPFGDYILEEEIARGGMGIVYRAQQISLDRTVAVKVMKEGVFAAGREVERFRQEASAAAALQHPGIVPVFECGECEGRYFYAMEWIAGPNLAEVTRAHPASAKQAAQWVKEIAEAMKHAHARGVVHRDLKPANVMLDSEGRVRVTDFGMAQRADTASGLTLSGQMLGTPGYMAPEVAGGNARTAGGAADVYGLGAILFHLLTGRAPFIGESHTAILKQLAEAEAPSPRSLLPDLPRDLDSICDKALSREPRHRYLTAAALADDLERFLLGQPVKARPVSVAMRLWRKTRRHPALALSAVVVAALGGGVIVLATTSVPPGPVMKETVTPDFDFTAASGASRRGVIGIQGGLTEQTTGKPNWQTQFIAASHLRGGLFTLTEDGTEPSPGGGPPGVLRFQITKLPGTEGDGGPSGDYWNFRLYPPLPTAWSRLVVTMDGLQRTRLRFRWKLTAGRTMDLRIEPSATDGYAARCDLGSLVGNGEWQQFNRPLSSGGNAVPFAAFLDTSGQRSVYLVFASRRNLSNYATGDELLLDDISLRHQ